MQHLNEQLDHATALRSSRTSKVDYTTFLQYKDANKVLVAEGKSKATRHCGTAPLGRIPQCSDSEDLANLQKQCPLLLERF